jgi:uncharacterized membrane protein
MSVRLGYSEGLVMEKIFGLPAHPLMVHLPVVLIPLVAIAAVLLAVRRDWRARFGTALAVTSALSCVSVFVAKESGEAMFEYMNQAPAIDRHQSLADTTVILTFLLFIAIAAMVFLQRRAGKRATTRLAVVASIVTISLAVMATVGTIATGHEGAKVTWETKAAGG